MPVDLATARRIVSGVPRWYHRVPLMPGLITPGCTDSEPVWERLGLPDDLTGQRVLDIGTADGYFAFRAERAGAEVVAIDSIRRPGFDACHEVLESRVRHVTCPIWQLDVRTFGMFDKVLFLGVLYHLRDPLAALHLLHSLCRGEIFVESYVSDSRLEEELGLSPDAAARVAVIPLMRFFPGRTLAGDPSNYWGPNHACLVQMLQETGFEVLSTSRSSDRAYAKCRPVSDPSRDPILAAASAFGHVPYSDADR